MSTLNGEPPTIREELERKVVEKIERVFLAVRAGKMTSYAYHQALEGLWGGVSEVQRSVTVLGEVVVVVRWLVGSPTVETTLKKPGIALVSKETRVEDESSASALRLFLTTTKKFRDQPGAIAL